MAAPTCWHKKISARACTASVAAPALTFARCYQNIGGHTYDTTYSGPIGSIITPHMRGMEEFKHLSYASSLCGKCTEVCPVKIDIHQNAAA
jgi:L-lactate utilization protein LutB